MTRHFGVELFASVTRDIDRNEEELFYCSAINTAQAGKRIDRTINLTYLIHGACFVADYQICAYGCRVAREGAS